MDLSLTIKQFRRLLDLVFIGNWVINSTRGDDRIVEFDDVESLLFGKCGEVGMDTLTELLDGCAVPSRAFAEGGIREVVNEYEDTVFFEILAEELARRDVINDGGAEDDEDQIGERMNVYIAEFEQNGTDNIVLDV